jgi:hypothetical protein
MGLRRWSRTKLILKNFPTFRLSGSGRSSPGRSSSFEPLDVFVPSHGRSTVLCVRVRGSIDELDGASEEDMG